MKMTSIEIVHLETLNPTSQTNPKVSGRKIVDLIQKEESNPLPNIHIYTCR